MANRDFPEYSNWKAMRKRCKCNYYTIKPRYKDKGITVCTEWDDFHIFLKDMGPKPGVDFSVDRIDGTKGYYKENCRWATPKQQLRNTSVNRKVLLHGKVHCLMELADLSKIKISTLRMRLYRGWSIEDSLAVPVEGAYNKYQKNKRRKSAWARNAAT